MGFDLPEISRSNSNWRWFRFSQSESLLLPAVLLLPQLRLLLLLLFCPFCMNSLFLSLLQLRVNGWQTIQSLFPFYLLFQSISEARSRMTRDHHQWRWSFFVVLACTCFTVAHFYFHRPLQSIAASVALIVTWHWAPNILLTFSRCDLPL